MSDAVPTPFERRNLLRSGAIMAGVAAGAVAATAGIATKAEAATGGNLILGNANSADQTTSLVNTGAEADPTLTLTHDNDGPTLRLTPASDAWDGDLEPGEIVNTGVGPYIGTVGDEGNTTDYLATGFDLAFRPVTYAVGPVRLVDTRLGADQDGILATSGPNAFDSAFRLTKGSWFDLAVEFADADFTMEAGFFNLTSTQSLAPGHLTAYPPGDLPDTSTLNFQKGITIANGTFVALDVVQEFFALRIYAAATTHVIVDYTGASITEFPGPVAEAAARKKATTRRRRPARRIQSVLGRKSR